MKKLSFVLLLLTSLVIIAGCGSKEKKSESEFQSNLKPMELVIPDELKDNPEAVEHLEKMAEAIDAYAKVLEALAREVHKMGLKEGQEPTTMQKIKLAQVVAKHYMEMAKYAEPMANYFEKGFMLTSEMSDQEIVAFQATLERFNVRMREVEKEFESVANLADL